MATDRRFLPSFLSSDADFRTWAQGIEAQILAMGLVVSTDTGQLTLATATKPVAINTYAGYRIYRFDDALQATKPFFLKIEYGVGGAVDRPAMRVSAGTATNGAGTFTGLYLSPAQAIPPTSSKVAGGTLESFCAGSTSRLNLVTNLDPAASAFACFLLAERTTDPDGTPNGAGVLLYIGNGSSAWWHLLAFQGAATTQSNSALWPGIAGHQMSDGLNVALQPLVVSVGGRTGLASFLRYVHTDIGELVAITVAHLGSNRPMMPMGDGLTGAIAGGAAGLSLALRWE